MTDTKYLTLLKKSEKFCEQHNLTDYDNLVHYTENQKQHHEVFTHSDDENDEYGYSYGQFETDLCFMIEAAYYEAQLINKETYEVIYYSFCYHENDDRPSCIYRSILHDKPEEEYAELTCEYITLEEFNKFFENATEEKLQNFKCLKPCACATVFIELLKSSEKYCEEHDLSTHEDFYKISKKYDETKQFLNEDRDHAIEVMKNAAFYECSYDEENHDIRHRAFVYLERAIDYEVCSLSLLEHKNKFEEKHYNVFEFSNLMSSATTEQMKCFKCFRYM